MNIQRRCDQGQRILATKSVNEHGPGHREDFYHNAMAIKLLDERFHLVYEDECELPVFDQDERLVYVYRPDFVVEDAVLVEIRAHHHPLNNDEIAQVLDYFAASEFNVALRNDKAGVNSNLK